MEQVIRFCGAPDGVRLAYAAYGHGPVIVKAAHWPTHLEYDWRSPVWRHWLDGLGIGHRVVRYDERGCGLSDRDPERLTLDAFVDDLAAVVDAAGVDQFALLGASQGAAVGDRVRGAPPGAGEPPGAGRGLRAGQHPAGGVGGGAGVDGAAAGAGTGRLGPRRSDLPPGVHHPVPAGGSCRWRAATTSCWRTSRRGRSSSPSCTPSSARRRCRPRGTTRSYRSRRAGCSRRTQEVVRELLGDGVSELTVTTRTVTQRLLSPEHFASFFQTNYGPTLATLARLSDDGRRAFQKDLIALAGASNRATDGTLVSDWEFQIAVGTRA